MGWKYTNSNLKNSEEIFHLDKLGHTIGSQAAVCGSKPISPNRPHLSYAIESFLHEVYLFLQISSLV